MIIREYSYKLYRVLCDAIIKLGATVLFRTKLYTMKYPDAIYEHKKDPPRPSLDPATTSDVKEKKEYLFMQIHINYSHVCTSSYAINLAFVTCKQCNLIHQLREPKRGFFMRTVPVVTRSFVLFSSFYVLPSISITLVINYQFKQRQFPKETRMNFGSFSICENEFWHMYRNGDIEKCNKSHS